MTKPRARQENGAWLVWCDRIGPSPRASFIDAYRAWAHRRAAVETQKQGFVKVEIGA